MSHQRHFVIHMPVSQLQRQAIETLDRSSSYPGMTIETRVETDMGDVMRKGNSHQN